LSAPAATPRPVALVAAGGAAGAVLRYQLGRWFPTPAPDFPTTTLVVNVAGALAIGVLYAWLPRRRPQDSWRRPLLGIGVLGAFTTFSTLCTETLLLVRADAAPAAAAYVATSLAAGLLAVIAGIRIGRGPLRADLASGES
jgi:CrcB protein